MGVVVGGPAEGDGDSGYHYSVIAMMLWTVDMVAAMLGKVVRTVMVELVSQRR